MKIEQYRENIRKIFTKLTNIPLKGVSRLENVRDVREECEVAEDKFRDMVAGLVVDYRDEMKLVLAMEEIANLREKLGQAGAL
jgi:hypothetical protein